MVTFLLGGKVQLLLCYRIEYVLTDAATGCFLTCNRAHEFDRCDQCGNVYKWTAYEPDEFFPDNSGDHHH